MDLFEAAAAPRHFEEVRQGVKFTVTRWTQNPGPDQKYTWLVGTQSSKSFTDYRPIPADWQATQAEIMDYVESEIWPTWEPHLVRELERMRARGTA